MQLKDTPFVDLMQKRICNVLLIANPYDAFMLEDDGRIDEKIFTEYAKVLRSIKLQKNRQNSSTSSNPTAAPTSVTLISVDASRNFA